MTEEQALLEEIFGKVPEELLAGEFVELESTQDDPAACTGRCATGSCLN